MAAFFRLAIISTALFRSILESSAAFDSRGVSRRRDRGDGFQLPLFASGRGAMAAGVAVSRRPRL